MTVLGESKPKCYSLDEALDATGFGKYNVCLMVTCCALIVAMYVDIFGFSVLMPAVACDLRLSTAQQGLLSAVPLIGVMVSSYAWGLCADTRGRRSTLAWAMPAGALLNLAASLAPNYASLAVIKFLSGAFTASANAAAFVLLGESVPPRLRSRMMFLMATSTMVSQFLICSFALPVFNLKFRVELSWLGLEYRPWRLLMQVICLPGIIGCLLCCLFTKESPKFLLCKERDEEAMDVLRTIYSLNTGNDKSTFPVKEVHFDDILTQSKDTSLIRRMWNQTVPLFKPPLLKNSLMLYYLLLCAYMTSTGFTMWVPTMTNAYFNGNDATGKTFCEVASQSTTTKNSTATDCDNTIDVNAIYATMVYSILPAILTVLLSFLVGPFGKKKTTQLVFVVSIICGFTVLFVKIPILSIGLFFIFLYASLILGNVNTYLIELNPTHLRGMATCLSVVVARGFGFMSVQLIALLMADYCTPMLTGYVLLVTSGLLISVFLPPDVKQITESDVGSSQESKKEVNNV